MCEVEGWSSNADCGCMFKAENDNLPIHEDKAKGVHVKGLSDFYVGNAPDVFEIMRQGGSSRAVSSTRAFLSLGAFEIVLTPRFHAPRNELGVVAVALDLRHHRPGAQHGDGHAEDGFALPRRPRGK